MLGRAKQPGVARPDIFTGREPGTLLADGTVVAMFELLHAPVCSQDDLKVTDIVFIDGGSKRTLSLILWPEGWAWWGPTQVSTE